MKRLLLAQLALTILAAAQAPITPPPPIRVLGGIPQNGEGVINGLVKRRNNEEPIPDVQITLTGGPSTSATDTVGKLQTATDSNGRFVFRSLSPGQYTIGIQREGYFRRYLPSSAEVTLQPGERSGGTVFLGPGRSEIAVVYSLIEGGTISGRILDPQGRAAVAANVRAAHLGYEEGQPFLGPGKETTTDDRGEYRLFGLEPGEYFVVAEKSLPSGPAKGYFPGGDDARSAIKVRVDEGEESAKTDFSLASAPATVRVSGVVTNTVAGFETTAPPAPLSPGATPQARALWDVRNFEVSMDQQFFLVPLDGARIYDGLTVFPNVLTGNQGRAEGKFELRNVRPGSYELYAVFRNRSVSPAKSYVAHQTIDVGGQDVEGVALVIAPGIDLMGRVSVGGRAPVNPVRVQLRPKVDFPGFPSATVVSTDGTFSIPNVPESQYRISIETSEPNSYVAELFQGRANIVEHGIVIVARGLPNTLEVLIKAPAAVLRGTVSATPEQLAAGLMVTLVPDESRQENFALYKRVIVKTDGIFTFDGIVPGTYKLFAWEGLPDGAEKNEEFMGAYRDRGTEIVTSAGKTSSVTLRLNSR